MFNRPQFPIGRSANSAGLQTPHSSARELARQSETELVRLLQSLKMPTPPGADQARPTQCPSRATPATTAPQSHVQPAPSSATQTPRSDPPRNELPNMYETITETRTALTVATIGLTIAVAFAVIQSLKADGVAALAIKETTTLRSSVTELAASHHQFQTSTITALQQMKQALAEVKYPPSEYVNAVNAFRESRYVDAESGFRAFVLKYPNSKVVDKALLNAAVSAGMRGRCGMVDSYQAMLLLRQPEQPRNNAHNNDFTNVDLATAIKDIKSVAASCRQVNRN